MNISKKSKDILQICKGWYNKDKFNTILDALKAYQCKETYCESQYMNLSSIYLWLIDTAKEIFTIDDWSNLFIYTIPEDLRFNTYNLKSQGYYAFDYEYFCGLIISKLTLMDVKNDSGEWIIDLSEYENVKKIV